MKKKIIILALLPLMLMGCDSLFDVGDTDKVYDGPPLLGFFPLQQEVSQADGTITVEVQLIAEQRTSDLPVTFSVNGSSTAVAGTHFNITTPSPVTLAAGTSTVDIEIELIDGSLNAGDDSVTLILDMEGTADVQADPNLDQSRTFIAP
ncbi:Calx-beta domain-containing protein [Rhodohalobacter mucosus]|uniref:Calx-beta domain-containing protein n=1 Tax=Rhodohalobacter mucosus TaxID=2079485 RepID=A0A316TL05_9BACT|nr:Calx-beta domain-containing protein [Rhodohalobacter mucosus]PWN05243.1 hypothetical protein DDZ15_14265 [Rhodohalobacter mucosus]